MAKKKSKSEDTEKPSPRRAHREAGRVFDDDSAPVKKKAAKKKSKAKK